MVSPHHVALGESVRRQRERRGMTLEGLALASGIAVADLEAFEEGRLDMEYSLICNISEAFGVGAPNFFDGTAPFWSVEDQEGVNAAISAW